MTEKQADQIINLLTTIVEKLNSIESDIGWVQTNTSNINSTVQTISEEI